MTDYAADAVGDIASRMRQIRRDEGRPDRDVGTATSGDLDLIAADWGVTRGDYEMDYSLRAKVREAMRQRGRL